MPEIDHPEPSPASPDIHTLDNLARDLENIKTDISRLKRNRLAKFATVIALLGAVISGVNGYFSLHDNFVKSPKTSVIGGSTLEFVYEPSKKDLMRVKFSLSLQNLGNVDDTILSAYARVGERSADTYAPLTGFKCTFGSSSLEQSTFTVPKATNTTAMCEVSTNLGSLSRETFSKPGIKQFSLDMSRGSGQALKWATCFGLDPSAAQAISKKKFVSRQILLQGCN